jgi:pimeloyl-ACP methyl ester carboxylesterase
LTDYRRGSVTSADGTVIEYRQLGAGPAVLLVHGGMQAAQSFMRLAAGLAADFSVYVPDRRGRGRSGGHGPDFSVQREVEDMQALTAAARAGRIFGLSSGALVVLRTALATPALERVAVYEPPLSVRSSVPVGWLPRFDAEIASGRPGAALVTALKGTRVEPVLGRVPRALLQPVMSAGMRVAPRPAAGDVPMAALIPTQHFDMRIVTELADTTADYAAIRGQVLLLGGARSPAYLRFALDQLAAVIPDARQVVFPGLGHTAPANDGDPARVGAELREFFSGSA